MHLNLQLRPAKRDGATRGARIVQLLRNPMQHLKRGIAVFERRVRFVIGKPLLHLHRGQGDSIAKAVALFIEAHFHRIRRPRHACIQTGEIRGQPFRKHAHTDGR